MGIIINGFDAEESAKDYSAGFTLIPPGWYKAAIVESVSNQNKSGNGNVLRLTFELLDGSGRTVKEFYNYEHPKVETVNIARATIGKIVVSCGASVSAAFKASGNNTDVLHGNPLEIQVENESYKGDDGKERQSNKVKDYRAIRAAGAVSSPTIPATGSAPATATAGNKAWMK